MRFRHQSQGREHFYCIINGKARVETEEGVRPVGPGDMIFIPAEEKHRLSSAAHAAVTKTPRTPRGVFSSSIAGRHAAIISPEPPNSAGKSFSFGRPSFMGSTVSA